MLTKAESSGLMRVVSDYVRDQIGRAVSPISERLANLEARQPDRGPQGERGADGAPGERGLDGERGPQGDRGLDGANGADGMPGPKGENGERGADGAPGRDGADGKNGLHGERGADGVGFSSAIIDTRGALILTMTDGSIRDVGVVKGADGKDAAPHEAAALTAPDEIAAIITKAARLMSEPRIEKAAEPQIFNIDVQPPNVTVDVHAHIPRRGNVVKQVTGYDSAGRITGMIEKESDDA